MLRCVSDREISMDIEDKIAVLKMVGFDVRSYEGNYEWVFRNDIGLIRYLGWDTFSTPESAWDSAWKFIQGDNTQEVDQDAWSTK